MGKMRNRRFMNACAQEMYMGGNMGMMGPQPGMMMQPPPMMWGPPTLDHEMAHDELSVLDQELNMTRRANRPFVPQHHQDYYSLQRQVQDMEQPMETPRRPMGEVTSVEQLPLPKRTAKSSTSEIATRSFVLGQSLGKVSGKSE